MGHRIKNDRPAYQKAKPVRDEKARKAWAKSRDHCAACGISRRDAPRRDGGLPLQTHHIIRGSRSDEPTNLLCVCSREHGLVHDDQYRDAAGNLLPKLTLGHILAIKHLREPDEFDAERLAVLFGSPLPDELPIPEFLEIEYRNRKPEPYRPWPEFDAVGCVTMPLPVIEEAKPVVVKEKTKKQDRRCARCIRLNLRAENRNCPACLRLQGGG